MSQDAKSLVFGARVSLFTICSCSTISTFVIFTIMSFIRSNSCERTSHHNLSTLDLQIQKQITSSLALRRNMYWATLVKLSVRRSSGSWLSRSARKCNRSSSCYREGQGSEIQGTVDKVPHYQTANTGPGSKEYARVAG